jgi:hypothetical protein
MASAAQVQAAANAANAVTSRMAWAESFPPSIDFDSRDDLRRAILTLVVKSLRSDADEGVITDYAVTQLITLSGNLGVLWDRSKNSENLIRALILSMMGPSTRTVGRQIRDWLLSNDPSWLTDAEQDSLDGLREGKGVNIRPTTSAAPKSSGKKTEDLVSGFWRDAEDTLFEIIGSGSSATIRVVSSGGRSINKVYTSADAKWSQVKANLIADRMSGKLKRVSAEDAAKVTASASPRRSSPITPEDLKQTVSRLPTDSPEAPAGKTSGLRPEVKKGLIIGGSIFGIAMLGLAAVLIFTPGESDVPQQP